MTRGQNDERGRLAKNNHFRERLICSGICWNPERRTHEIWLFCATCNKGCHWFSQPLLSPSLPPTPLPPLLRQLLLLPPLLLSPPINGWLLCRPLLCLPPGPSSTAFCFHHRGIVNTLVADHCPLSPTFLSCQPLFCCSCPSRPSPLPLPLMVGCWVLPPSSSIPTEPPS